MFVLLMACGGTRSTVDPGLQEALSAIRASSPPCMGSMSRVDVWRNDAGEVHRLYYHGDLSRCSHPPSIYYTSTGVELEPVGNEPLTDANRASFEALHARHQTGATFDVSVPLP